ncbi:hypothetical protein C5167_012172 [Papaver somniferum]|uniref:Uncharacterized protein n=1 Tax=Papaver somniferum TaxID=3469 RepID=A0A4Y7IYQ2_PAPSO|nr:hypothetical protein C5167_012172 [Papaver somniferum]
MQAYAELLEEGDPKIPAWFFSPKDVSIGSGSLDAAFCDNLRDQSSLLEGLHVVDVHVSISVVVNKWKDENDKFMTSRQWLDFCRVENSTSEGYPGLGSITGQDFFRSSIFFIESRLGSLIELERNQAEVMFTIPITYLLLMDCLIKNLLNSQRINTVPRKPSSTLNYMISGLRDMYIQLSEVAIAWSYKRLGTLCRFGVDANGRNFGLRSE